MDIPESRQRAKELVQQIAKDHGYLGEEKLRNIEPDLRREIEEAFLKKDLMIGSTVITLAKNLYTSKARFVFELLQNADDNSYTKATASGSVPYVSFHVHPRRIVLECNEDGFNNENLKAICSVGNSSKTGAQGYIGEKGIGFKSVFMAAWRVHIQSGAFSFSFRHKSGESGMGMISPTWEDTDEELEPPLTMITLHLHDTGDADMLERTRETIQEQFEELQETILLFMKNLRKVNVNFYEENGVQTSSTAYSIERFPPSNYAVLKRSKVVGGTTQEEQVKRFHVTTHTATNLAKNENRTYSDNEEATRAYSKSRIILAFPLSETSIPIIEPQDLFVFLPVRAVGFNFLIQADFVTDASRQDVVRDSLRNHGLLDGIADAFARSVMQFCEHETLRFQWMRYLPDKKDKNWGTLWLCLVNKIANRLSQTSVLYGQQMLRRYLIRDLFRLAGDCFDENGEPLFDDGNPEQIISQRYSGEDLNTLKDYGLNFASFHEIMEWPRKDLRRGALSRMKSARTTDGWHTRAAKLLHRPFAMKWANEIAHLRGMDLLPLEDGTWISASSGPVYFAQVEGMNIPSDVDLRLISKSVTNPHRRTLFKDLGVTTAPAELVRMKILERYALYGVPSYTPLETSKRHLEFLYRTEHLGGARAGEPSYRQLAIHDSEGNPYRPWDVNSYVANNEPYGACELLSETNPGTNPGDGAPGYPARFVNESYFMDGPVTTQDHELTWLEWFYSKLSVDRWVDLGDDTLGGAGRYLQEHRPEKFLGALRVWYKDSGRLSTNFINCLRETEVLCRGNRRVSLKDAYFPVQRLEILVKRCVEQDAFFPWLWLDSETTSDAIPSEWKDLLTQLDVGSPSTDLDFALDMVKYSIDAFPDPTTSTSEAKLFHLYDFILAKYREDEDRSGARRKISDVFYERARIYIPGLPQDRCTWAFPNQCVWNAPQKMKTKFALRLIYHPYFLDGVDRYYLMHFFTSVLEITNCTWETYVEELKELKALGCEDSDTVTVIYKALDALRPTIITTDLVKASFENDALIYVPSDDGPSWYKVSQCVWSTAAQLRGRVSLNNDYEDLLGLFVDFLGVKPVDLLMAIDELKEVGSGQSTPIQEVKDSIWTVNSLLATESRPPRSGDVVRGRIFPIRHPNGSVTCQSKTTEFLVVDREPLRLSFETKVKFLDFTLEEVVRLRPFLEWTHLEDRYLSYCVKEITSFHGGAAQPTLNTDRQIRNRAYALLRVAAHFNSPRTTTKQDLESFHSVLQNAEICETHGISADLTLSQDGNSYQVEGEKTTLHLDEDQSGLKVYVPRNKDDQEYMFAAQLPEKLFEWIMKHPVTQISEGASKDGVDVVKVILLTPRSLLTRALEDNGIATISVADLNLDEDVLSDPETPTTPRAASEEASQTSTPNDEDGSDSDSDHRILETPASSVLSPPRSRHSASASGRNTPFDFSRPPRTSSDDPFVGSPTPEPATPAQPAARNPHYVAFLSEVIAAARTSNIPSRGASSTSYLQGSPLSTGDGTHYGLRSVAKTERDCMVGAAGELYVFELLSHLLVTPQIPGFSRNNWQSNVRKYVTGHPEYADMEPWTGRETSDIVYNDWQGVLTSHLVDKGYLAGNVWTGKKPKYFIEVKATTLSCVTPFYMSKAQYRRMKDNSLRAENSDTIYVIFRVYYLGRSGKPGLQIYLDPETFRLSQQLEFTAETWSVVPGVLSLP